MNSIQIADETFVAADPVEVGKAIGNPANWRRWWPDLLLTVVEDRGELGHRWTVAGALTGTMEIWLEPVLDGVVLQAREIRATAFLSPGEVHARSADYTARRVDAALASLQGTGAAFTESGRTV